MAEDTEEARAARMRAKLRKVRELYADDPAILKKVDEELSLLPPEPTVQRALTPAQSAKVERAKQTDFFPASKPSYLEEFGKGANVLATNAADEFSMGATTALLDKLGVSSPEERARLADEMPWEANVGKGAGLAASMVAGPAGAIARGTQAGRKLATKGLEAMMQRSVPAVLGSSRAARATRGLGRVAATGAEGAASSAVYGAAEAGIKGQDQLERAKQDALLGGAGGAVLGGAGELLGVGYNAVRNTVGGKARELIEKYGGKVGLTTPGEGGALSRPPLAGLDPTDVNIGGVSRTGAADVLADMDTQHFAQVVDPHVATKAAIAASPAGMAPRDVSGLITQLEAVRDSARLSKGEASGVQSLIDRLETFVTRPGGAGAYASEADLNDFRGLLQDASNVAKHGPQAVDAAKIAQVGHAAKVMVDQGPYAATNKAFHEGTEAYEANRRLFGLDAKPRGRPAPEGPPESEIRQVSRQMTRAGQNTATAGEAGSAKFMEEFAAQNPQYAEQMLAPRLLEAKGDLTFGGKGLKGGILERIPAGMSVPIGVIMAAASQNPKMAVPALLAEILARNSAPISGRVLYPMLRGGQSALPASAPYILPAFLPEIEQSVATAKRLAEEKAARKALEEE